MPNHQKPMTYEEEEMQNHLAKILADPHHQDNPLLDELRLLADKYFRLARKLDKIAKISDQFQVQIRELNEVFQRAALTDPLTNLPNRRYILVRLEAELNRSARTGKPFALLMADLDHFKHINDTYGHIAGDRVLSDIAKIFREDLRKHDVCARWGGEEFLILLSETDSDNAFATAERLRQKVATQLTLYEGQSLSITISLGVSLCSAQQSVDDCIRQADTALYRAKRDRNRAVMLND